MVDKFLIEARHDGLKLLVFQANPPRLVATVPLEQFPDALGAALAHASIQIGAAAKEDVNGVLHGLVAHAVARAEALLAERKTN